jgi:uncharacterized membrane protein
MKDIIHRGVINISGWRHSCGKGKSQIRNTPSPDYRMELKPLLARTKRPLLYIMSALYIVAGVMHFVVPELYVQIVPPYLPFPLVLVYVSGIAEIVLGAGLLTERTRRLAAWGVIALLVAIFPANLYMATSDVVIQGAPEGIANPSEAARWGRLPLQAVLIAWAWWYTRPMPDSTETPK